MPRGRDLPLDTTPATDDVVVTWKATGGTRKATLGSLPGSPPAGAANLVQATPNASFGTAALRALVPADLPAATTSANGAVTLATPSSDVTAGHVVQASDTRLSNSRTPTAHHASHEPGGSDPMAVDAGAATGSLRTLGTGATQAAAGNDSRLSDARTPTAHAASHKNGGADEIATATPTANAIPKAGSGGTLAAGWIPTLNQNTTGTAGGLSATNDVAHGGTGAVTLAAHGVVIGNGTGAVAVTGTGTAGQVLTSNGAGADPTFQAASGGIGGTLGTTANALARASGTGGATAQGSAVVVDDSGNMTVGGAAGGWTMTRRRWLAPADDFDVPLGLSRSGITNDGAALGVTFSLPAATVGAEFAVAVDSAHSVTLQAMAGEVIYLGASASSSGGTLSSSTVGSTVILACSKTGVWHTLSSGSWAVA